MDGKTRVCVCVWLRSYLASNPDEEVDHSVCMLFLNRFVVHAFCAWHGLAAAKYLQTQTL